MATIVENSLSVLIEDGPKVVLSSVDDGIKAFSLVVSTFIFRPWVDTGLLEGGKVVGKNVELICAWVVSTTKKLSAVIASVENVLN